MRISFANKFAAAALMVLMLFFGCKKKEEIPCVCAINYTSNATAQLWEQVSGADSMTSNFPDRYAYYIIYRVDRTNLHNIRLRVRGYFPDARYMSYNIYNENNRVSLGALLDANIKPCCTGRNPFKGEVAFGGNDLYTVNFVPAGADTSGLENVMLFDNSIDSLTIMMRYYLPVGGLKGGVELPNIEAFDIATGDSLPTPPYLNSHTGASLQATQAMISQLYAVDQDSMLYCYNLTLQGLYNNLDNQYLCMPVNVNPGEVYMLRFRKPSFAATSSQNNSADVRYWSINQGNDKTYVFSALKDDEMKVGSDGFVNLVIADFDSAVNAKAAGLNKMEIIIPSGTRMFLIYRNLVTRPGFAGNMMNVPYLELSNLGSYQNYRANSFVGDYAPVGKRMSRQAFLDNFGGMQVSY